MSTLKDVIAKVGGISKAAAVCGVSVRAVYKWVAADALPRTEYTGETDYLGSLAIEAAKSGVVFDPVALKQELIAQRKAA